MLGSPTPGEGDSAFLYRDARPEDKAEVLAFTAHTWEDGDYIQHVYDDWLNDKSGRFIAAVDRVTGKIAAIDKLSFFSPAEAWFEGLRVNPEYRGAGLATRMQRYMIGQAANMGARTIRLLTLVTNLPIHRKAYRDGFRRRFTVRMWKWSAPGPTPGHEGLRLRHATPEEAPLLYHWWLRSSAQATDNLVHDDWTFKATSLEDWTEQARVGNLYVMHPTGESLDAIALPPPTALIKPSYGNSWSMVTLTAFFGEDWERLGNALISVAAEQGIAGIRGLLPDSVDALNGLRRAGFTPDPDDERLCLFELLLGT